MPPSQQANCHNAGAQLRSLMKSGASVWYTRHASKEELPADNIAKIDVENMLRRCIVTLIEERGDEVTWRAEGKDSDGRSITAVVVPYLDTNSIKVITGWAGKRK